MSEGIIYADLRFSRNPLDKKTWEEPNEEELTYENVQGCQNQETPQIMRGATELSCRIRSVALGALGLSLFILTVVTALGVQYSQVSQRLHQRSQDHAAERHDLGERLHALQNRLAEMQLQLQQTKEDLNSTTTALQESWSAANGTLRQLQQLELLLSQVNRSRALLHKEKETVEAELRQASSCQQIGCCPTGWKLFRWKCLWISSKRGTWEASRKSCQQFDSSQLLVLNRWSVGDLWDIKPATQYWIGVIFEGAWFWVGNPYEIEISSPAIDKHGNGKCGVLHEGTLKRLHCTAPRQYICEKPASAWPVDIWM